MVIKEVAKLHDEIREACRLFNEAVASLNRTPNSAFDWKTRAMRNAASDAVYGACIGLTNLRRDLALRESKWKKETQEQTV